MRNARRALVATATIVALGCGGDSPTPTGPTSVPPPVPPSTAGRFDVSFQGAGVTMGGILYRPELASGTTAPAVIVLHGWQTAGTNGAALVEPRTRRYAEEGYVSLAMSMRGWPPSGGGDDCGLRQPDDVSAAAAWLAQQPGVDANRIGIVGFSQGGQVALLTASRRARVRAVVAYYPVTDVELWKTTTANADIPGYVTGVCEPGGTAPRSPRLQASTISVPVLLVHGDRDTRVPTDQSRLMQAALEAAAGSSTLFIVPGAEHGFTAAQEADARPVVDAFLGQWLR